MKKIHLLPLFLFLSTVLSPQKQVEATNEITIFGLIDGTKTVSFSKIAEGQAADK